MHRTIWAERLLSVVMPPERAASTVGDILELSPGPAAFWSCCTRTVCATAFRQLSGKVVVKTFLFSAILTLLLRWAAALVAFNLVRLTRTLELWWTVNTIFLLFAPAFIGWRLARWQPGREIGVWLSAILLAITQALIQIFLPSARDLRFLVEASTLPVIGMIPMLAGVLLARRNSLQRTSTA